MRFPKFGMFWDVIAQGKGIAINEQFARRNEIEIGDVITTRFGDIQVAGIYGDYGNPIGQGVIGLPLFEQVYPDQRPLRFGLRVAPDDVADVMYKLTETLGISPENIVDQKGIKAFSLGVFEQTFSVTTALNILTLAVAGFAILMSLLTLSAMRLPQLAPAWAMGFTRAQLGRLELIRAACLAAFTSALAIPLGLGLAWVLLAVVNVEAFGWKLPMYVFPVSYLALIALAFGAALLAALWPARILAKTPPVNLLQVFSNER